MRNRKFEAAMIIAIGGLTTLVVGSYIHDSESGKPDLMTRQVSQMAKRVGGWMMQHESSNGVQTSGVTAMAQTSSIASDQAPSATDSDASDASAPLSYSDDQRLISIAKSLSGELTQADWDAMAKAVETEDSTDAAKTLKQILWTKLSTEDQQWVLAHFQGKQAFGPDDVVLVKDVIQEVQSMLTPDERSLLQQQLAHLGIDIGQ
ncbi:hypothetical protein AAC03nite_16490 [Alicyclobacillus acidoterrestris]|uniref:hypothetical protein n=1 Tax=Alicyclobacillus suci TaxID=2816080 RepID=UPI00118F3A1E|nr:hypothetical protein [Alicyclobacillus suci]GEO25864.1 hypothetical protein AAC03nite_16490 [Alicyclobacillus acidoterrestris]